MDRNVPLWPKALDELISQNIIGEQTATIENISAMVEANPDLVFAKDENGLTLLHHCARMEENGVNLARFLLTKSPDLAAVDKHQRTAFHFAALYDLPEFARLLLQTDPTLANTQDSKGNTPLHTAIIDHSSETLRMLLRFNADTSIKNYKDKTSLQLALSKERPDLVRILLRGNLDPDSRTAIKSGLLLQKFIGDYNGTRDETTSAVECARLLLTAGSDITIRNEFGHTLLHLAIREERTQIARMLLKKGADINAADTLYQSTPLHYAADGRDTTGIRLLLAHGGNINARNNEGQTPLHIAADGQNHEIIRYLLSAGADPEIVDNEGNTPAQVIKNNGKKVLLSRFNRYCTARKRQQEKAEEKRKETAQGTHAARLQKLDALARGQRRQPPSGV